VLNSCPHAQASADLVYGQPDMANSTSGATASTLAEPAGVALDDRGNLYVADSDWDRVLYYPIGSTTATAVHGQTTMAGTGASGTSATSMDMPSSVAVDPYGGLYVADQMDNRVLYFPAGGPSGPARTTATVVYGQPNMTGDLPGGSPTSLSSPEGLAVDRHGGLYVADSGNNRVLYFPPGGSGGAARTTAAVVYGQPSMAWWDPGVGATGLYYPGGLAVDDHGGLYVADRDNNRVLYFPASVGTGPAQRTAIAVYGQAGMLSCGTPETPSATTVNRPAGVALDSHDGLYVADFGNDRVLYYPPGSTGAGPAQTTASAVYGQPDMASSGPGTSTTSLSYPDAVAVDSIGNLYVSDGGNRRVLRFPATAPSARSAATPPTPAATATASPSPSATPTSSPATALATTTGSAPATAAAVATTTSTLAAAAASLASCPGLPVAMPDPRYSPITLNGVAAVSATDVWAVGYAGTSGSTYGPPLIEHYDGKAWREVDSHDPAGSPLNAVAAVNAHDVWAVGHRIEHWNGHAWTVVADVYPPGSGYGLTSVSASSAVNVWAAGNGQVERWDGKSWQAVPLPASLDSGQFESGAAIATLSASDTWLATESPGAGGAGVILHWNGRQWQDLGLPQAPPPPSYSAHLVDSCNLNYAYHVDLSAIVALGHDDVWIGGGAYRRPEECPLLFHWNGKVLREVWAATTPQDVALLEQALGYQPDNPDGSNNYVAGWFVEALAAVGPMDIWAMVGADAGTWQNRMLHWDGHQWQVVSTAPFPLTGAVSAVSSTDVWAVGPTPADGWNAYHWNGILWQGVAAIPMD
jgi:sugar lactone lactonase YvrE